MNIALSAVIIFILLFPPIAFYISYSFGNFPKAGPKFSFPDSVLATAIVSLFVHAIAISLIPNEIRFDILIKLLGGEIKAVESSMPNQTFSKSIQQFAIYNFVILFLFTLLGRIARFIVIRSSLNNGRNNLFRLNNRWWYLFNGYESDIESFDLLLLDAIVETKDGTMIYSGYLINYICNGEDLERIYLRDAVRKEFKVLDADGNVINQTGTPITIPGETFSIDYKNIINLNLRFLELTDPLEADKELEEKGEDNENDNANQGL